MNNFKMNEMEYETVKKSEKLMNRFKMSEMEYETVKKTKH